MPLPTPTHADQIHSQKLSDLIRQKMAEYHGKIPFSQFMQLALYAPELGYYNSTFEKIGKKGDFITAPEISPLFAKCIAAQCRSILKEIPGGDFLELGAGSGRFAQVFLETLAENGPLPKHYYILEISKNLRERQKKLLAEKCPQLFSRIQWLEKLPENFQGIIFANEVLDAMPVECFKIENGIHERWVSWKNNQFCWTLTHPVTPHLFDKIAAFHLEEGYESEINLGLAPWIKNIADNLKEGVFLIFDYGYGQREYYHPDRAIGTLMCHYQHHRHADPLILPGLQDITAHVDFTMVAEQATEAGLQVSGYTTQASFLMAAGLSNLITENHPPLEKYRENQAIKRLILPSEMGEIIKVMALTQDFSLPLQGFSLHDRRRDL